MGIHFHGSNAEADIFYVDFEPPWTWQEFDARVETMQHTIQEIPHPVALIVDVSNVGRLRSGNVLEHLRYSDSLMPENVNTTVLVGAPYSVITFMSILMRIRPRVKQIVVYAESIEEARELIHERRQKHEPAANGR